MQGAHSHMERMIAYSVSGFAKMVSIYSRALRLCVERYLRISASIGGTSASHAFLKGVTLAQVLLMCALLAAGAAEAAGTRDPEQHFFNPNTGDLKAELADARSAGKKAIFVMYEQEGCPGCIYMKTHVLSHPDVQKFYREHFFNFAIDIFGSVPITGFAGGGYAEKSFAQAQKVKGTPTLVFHDLDGNEIVRIVGPVRDTAEFMLLGEYIASGAYKSRTFAEYKDSRRK